MRIKFTQAARKHRIGVNHVRYVMTTAIPTTATATNGTPGWQWQGLDDRNVELTVIAVEATWRGEDVLLVIHVQPTYERN